jgi:hypothetical protein
VEKARDLGLMVIEEALSRECDSPLAVNHAACTQGPIFQAWDGKDIFCPCACHVLVHLGSPFLNPEEALEADMKLTHYADEQLRPNLPPRDGGFVASVLQIRAVMQEVGMVMPPGAYWHEVAEWVYADKELPDGRHAWVVPQLLGQGRIIIGKNVWGEGIDEGWDYETLQEAITAFGEYDGTKEPEGWVRNTALGRVHRRRPEGDATKEYTRE